MSAGLEGPIAQIGGSIGSTVGRGFQPSFQRLRMLIGCGSAAAISASFSSPIAGVMFAQEVVLVSEFEAKHFYLIILAAGASTVTSAYVSGAHRILHAPSFDFPLNHELLLYLLLGVLCGLLAVAFIRILYAIRDVFLGVGVAPWIPPIVGGVIVGTSLIFFPQVSASGYATINRAFQGHLGVDLLVALVAMKILMTSVTLGCGGSGGVFAPAMFIGAMLGGAVGTIANSIDPQLVAQPGAFAMVGMGSFLAAATHAPMTSVFMLWELTQDMRSVVPAMLTSVTATLVARALLRESVDTYELGRKGIDVHRSREANVLGTVGIRAIVDRDVGPMFHSTTISDFLRRATRGHHTTFPVVADDGTLLGVITMDDVRNLLLDHESWDRTVVGDVVRRDAVAVRESDSAYAATRIFGDHAFDALPVVAADDPRRCVGLLTRAALAQLCRERLAGLHRLH
jgi:CIC family chloride channel protein